MFFALALEDIDANLAVPRVDEALEFDEIFQGLDVRRVDDREGSGRKQGEAAHDIAIRQGDLDLVGAPGGGCPG